MIELYNEGVFDLLSSSGPKGGLRIRESKAAGTYVENLTEAPVRNVTQMEQLIKQGILSRTVAATRMNAVSSRSHLIININFQQFFTHQDGSRVNRTSRIRLVDMAGSERASMTRATGDRLREGAAINMSLSGLSSVIAALSRQERFVPYRNSKFTRIMKDALGGNSCTTMMAAVSPALWVYEETLSTLRLVDRASSVVQKPVINDTVVDNAISELQERVKTLEQLLKDTTDEDEIKECKELMESVSIEIQQLQLPWKEKETKETGATWWSMTVKVERPELDSQPYLQNVAEDPQQSGIIKHSIPQGTLLLGKTGTDKVQLELDGLGIKPWHAILNNTGTFMTIVPCSEQAIIDVNGQRITTPVTLTHLDRVKLGASGLFVYVGFPSERSTGRPSKYSYETCLTELAEKHPLAKQLQPPPDCTARMKTAAMILFQEFTELRVEVEEASAIASLFGKNIEYSLKVHTEKEAKQLCVLVRDKDAGKESVWSVETFENRKVRMDEYYDRLLQSGQQPQIDAKNDPFISNKDPETLIGRGCLKLHTMAYLIPVDGHVPILDQQGRQCGILHVSMAPCSSEGEPLTQEKITPQAPKELVGKPVSVLVSVSDFEGIVWPVVNPQRGIYCKISMYGQSAPAMTETLYGKASGVFNAKFQFSFDSAGQGLMDFLLSEGLPIEVWGVQVQPSSGSQAGDATPASAQVPPKSQTLTVQQEHMPPSDVVSDKTCTASLENAEDETSKSNTAEHSDCAPQTLTKLLDNISPVKDQLTTLKHKALSKHSSKGDGEEAEAWMEFAADLQTAEDHLNKSIVTLQELKEHAPNHSHTSDRISDGLRTGHSHSGGSTEKSKACILQ